MSYKSSRHKYYRHEKERERSSSPTLHKRLKNESESRKQNRTSDRTSSSDREFNFLQFKYSLNKIFFRDQYFMKRGSKEYDDFWVFVEKYQNFQKRQREKTPKPCVSGSMETDLGIPAHYDKRYRINITLKNRDVEDFIKKGRLADAEIDKEITVERVKEFKNILMHYLDFQQKQKLAKLKKVKTDQENLPIFQYKSDIVQLVRDNQVVIVAGDTGCGKSTQVPQYLLQAGFEKIACTQPRRIACVSLSKRVGFETLNEYGSEVAFQVRFEKTKTSNTKILFLTEGLLLRQMTTDPHLSMYNVIVIDEVHERHIHTDFLLGVLKCLVHHRDDVKVILMSATINIDLFSNYFEDAPVLKVPGRLYPIEMEFCPVQRDSDTRSERLDPSPYLRIMQRIEKKYPRTERGDLLIFLSGLSEIMAVVEAARALSQQTKTWIVLPLHSALSVEEQEKVFDIAPEGVRKCIVSTNIAETSVTIDGVRFIVDSGKVKEMSFDPKYKMQRLQEFWISRASAEQRKGRAGRTGPGVCFRLYEEREYEAFQEYTTPEIQRVPLDSLVLQMISMGLPDPRKFPFIEAPGVQSLENAIIFLREQGAIYQDESLTPIGLMLSKLPVDVVIGKMLIMGSIFHMIDPVLSIAAAMSVQSPFTSKMHTDVDSMAARKSLESDHGDPFTLLNAFDEWIQVKAEGRGTKKWCKRRGLEEQRFYEMTKLKRQFKELLQDHGLLEKVEDQQQYLSSAERRQKHGERKRLGELRREQRKESKKRKVLKMDDEDYQISDGEDEKDSDIKDLEFRLSHNLQQLQETSNESRSFTLRDINLLKIILCSGLYPQAAIADDCNTFKANSEQAFHTKSKPFVLLHPTGVFSYKPELLHPKQDSEPGKHNPADLKGLLSNKHELLTFVSILETNKPYLINTMRVPALQTVTLFSNNIDTNSNCTRLICDGWLEITVPDEESAEQVMSSVIQLRATWQNLLKLRLEDTFLSMESERRISQRARKLERMLASKLTEFLSSDVRYTLRRVLAAEMKNVYIRADRSGEEIKDVFHTSTESKPHPTKGGLIINEYLTHGCLIDDGTASAVGEFTMTMQRHWTCPRCEVSMVVSIAERLEHEAMCQASNITATQSEDKADQDEEREMQMNPLRKSYYCAQCEKQLQLTVTEILRHKKSHIDNT
ncbi:probable ATP-dependent RNA helicase DHX34 [Mercenaria mercenaria]|uniref:probable ATP-dependent RNA helicase DHX34 n=1 Tax=Mercenaria mercenaria TaxID=6596 RepID=UPI00234F6B49|nr:probable ATP-dependent RNA helicase DHX34 [Mercenaria mercenaria]